MQIRLFLKTNKDYIEDSDVIVCDDKVITYYKRLFPNHDVEYKLMLLSQLFRYFPNKRCTTKQELNDFIKKWIPNSFNEESKFKTLVPDYITISELEELDELLRNEVKRV